jgi:hypothetical protein
MEPLFGFVRELFYVETGNIYYAGTYKCVRLGGPLMNWPSSDLEGLVRIVDLLLARIVDQCLPSFTAGPFSHGRGGLIREFLKCSQLSDTQGYDQQNVPGRSLDA